MDRHIRSFFRFSGTVFVLFWVTRLFAAGKPDWVDGPSSQYPDTSYMVGVGFGDHRQAAENSAYAALARVFKTHVRSEIIEQEAFQQMEDGSKQEIDRRVDIQSQTGISTDKVLEQVRIVERWVDLVSQVHYALAVLDRAQAASSLRQRSLEAEREAEMWEGRAKRSSSKLEQARALRKAIQAARLNEAYRADLRIVQPTGEGISSVHSAALQDQLRSLLSRHFQIGVQITGPHADAVRDAILAGLHEKGFASGPQGDILIQGKVDFEVAGPQDPQWHYVRWQAHLTLIEEEMQKAFGSINRSGREGQLSPSEAERKALSALQREITDTVGESVLQWIYGEGR
jgi:hypothetical protein